MDGITLRSGTILPPPVEPHQLRRQRALPLVAELVLRYLLNLPGERPYATSVHPDARQLMMRMIAHRPHTEPTLKKLYHEAVILRANSAPYPHLLPASHFRELEDFLKTSHGCGVRLGNHLTSLNLLDSDSGDIHGGLQVKQNHMLQLMRLCPNMQRLQVPMTAGYSGIALLNCLSEQARRNVVQWTFVPADMSLLPQGDELFRQYPNLTEFHIEPTLDDWETDALLQPISLPEMVSQRATVLTCDSVEVTDLNLPRAHRVEVIGSAALTKLTVAQATHVRLLGCQNVAEVEAPQATDVHLSLGSLTSLDLGQAKRVQLWSLEALSSLHAPRATQVEIVLCATLARLRLEQATHVTMRCNPSLVELDVPRAESVSLVECHSLQTLQARGCSLLRDGMA